MRGDDDTPLQAATTADLCDELQELLHVFCSDVQQKFCIDQEVAHPQQLQRLQKTMQQIQRFIPLVGLNGSANADSLRHTLQATTLEILVLYETQCRQRHIVLMTDDDVEKLIATWHALSEAYEDKRAEHASLARFIGTIERQQQHERVPEHVVVTSMLQQQQEVRKEGMYVATVNKENYNRLGLGRRQLGTRQIVFETRQMSREDQEKAVRDLCDQFAALFMRHAHQQHLDPLAALLQDATTDLLAKRLKDELYDRVFLPTKTTAILSPNNLILASNTMTTVPAPTFAPAPWQWLDLIKTRTPYEPHLFGFMARRRSQQRPQDLPAFATLSVKRLCEHIASVGQQYYLDVINHAWLSYRRLSRALDRIESELVDIFACLQLEISRLAMQKILIILESLEQHHQHQHHKYHLMHNLTTTTSITTSTHSIANTTSATTTSTTHTKTSLT
ncbi:hypothetical protein BX666DRAFT_2023755 [Dichotomocladium elegans]|nr:hypothetical protein BX666DRAFT_2023755 [Dichotomocladium elegans]